MYKLCAIVDHPDDSYRGYTGDPIPENAIIKVFKHKKETTLVSYSPCLKLSAFYGYTLLYDNILPALLKIPHKRVLNHCRIDLIIRIHNNTHDKLIDRDLAIELRKISMICCNCEDCLDREYITDISRSPSPEQMFKRLTIRD
jgi:hypothetical protein